MQKTITLLFPFLLGMTLLAGCGQTSYPSRDFAADLGARANEGMGMMGTSAFRANDVGVSFNYPFDWEINENFVINTTTVRVVLQKIGFGEFTPNIFLLVQNANSNEKNSTQRAFERGLVAGLPKEERNKTFHFQKFEKGKFRGDDCIYMVYDTLRDGKVFITTTRYVIFHGNQTFSFTFACAPDDMQYDLRKKEFDALMNSVAFH